MYFTNDSHIGKFYFNLGRPLPNVFERSLSIQEVQRLRFESLSYFNALIAQGIEEIHAEKKTLRKYVDQFIQLGINETEARRLCTKSIVELVNEEATKNAKNDVDKNRRKQYVERLTNSNATSRKSPIEVIDISSPPRIEVDEEDAGTSTSQDKSETGFSSSGAEVEETLLDMPSAVGDSVTRTVPKCSLEKTSFASNLNSNEVEPTTLGGKSDAAKVSLKGVESLKDKNKPNVGSPKNILQPVKCHPTASPTATQSATSFAKQAASHSPSISRPTGPEAVSPFAKPLIVSQSVGGKLNGSVVSPVAKIEKPAEAVSPFAKPLIVSQSVGGKLNRSVVSPVAKIEKPADDTETKIIDSSGSNIPCKPTNDALKEAKDKAAPRSVDEATMSAKFDSAKSSGPKPSNMEGDKEIDVPVDKKINGAQKSEAKNIQDATIDKTRLALVTEHTIKIARDDNQNVASVVKVHKMTEGPNSKKVMLPSVVEAQFRKTANTKSPSSMLRKADKIDEVSNKADADVTNEVVRLISTEPSHPSVANEKSLSPSRVTLNVEPPIAMKTMEELDKNSTLYPSNVEVSKKIVGLEPPVRSIVDDSENIVDPTNAKKPVTSVGNIVKKMEVPAEKTAPLPNNESHRNAVAAKPTPPSVKTSKQSEVTIKNIDPLGFITNRPVTQAFSQDKSIAVSVAPPNAKTSVQSKSVTPVAVSGGGTPNASPVITPSTATRDSTNDTSSGSSNMTTQSNIESTEDKSVMSPAPTADPIIICQRLRVNSLRFYNSLIAQGDSHSVAEYLTAIKFLGSFIALGKSKEEAQRLCSKSIVDKAKDLGYFNHNGAQTLASNLTIQPQMPRPLLATEKIVDPRHPLVAAGTKPSLIAADALQPGKHQMVPSPDKVVKRFRWDVGPVRRDVTDSTCLPSKSSCQLENTSVEHDKNRIDGTAQSISKTVVSSTPSQIDSTSMQSLSAHQSDKGKQNASVLRDGRCQLENASVDLDKNPIEEDKPSENGSKVVGDKSPTNDSNNSFSVSSVKLENTLKSTEETHIDGGNTSHSNLHNKSASSDDASSSPSGGEKRKMKLRLKGRKKRKLSMNDDDSESDKTRRTIGIVPKNFPTDKISLEQRCTIEQKLSEMILFHKDIKTRPDYERESLKVENGLLLIRFRKVCAVDWIKENSHLLQLPDMAVEVVDFPSQLPVILRGTFKSSSYNTTEEILEFIAVQNVDLQADVWKVFHREDLADGHVDMVLVAPREEFETLKSQNFTIEFKFTTVTLEDWTAEDRGLAIEEEIISIDSELKKEPPPSEPEENEDEEVQILDYEKPPVPVVDLTDAELPTTNEEPLQETQPCRNSVPPRLRPRYRPRPTMFNYGPMFAPLLQYENSRHWQGY